MILHSQRVQFYSQNTRNKKGIKRCCFFPVPSPTEEFIPEKRGEDAIYPSFRMCVCRKREKKREREVLKKEAPKRRVLKRIREREREKCEEKRERERDKQDKCWLASRAPLW